MSSGFSGGGGGGGGGSDYFSAVGNFSGLRSASSLSNSALITNTTSTTNNNNNHSFNSYNNINTTTNNFQIPYRSLISGGGGAGGGGGSVYSDHVAHLNNNSNQQQQQRQTSLIGKRTLAEFQTHQQHQQLQLQQYQHHQQQQNSFNVPQNSELLGMYLRSVKPRMYQKLSPISPLSPVDLLTDSLSTSRRYGLHQQHHQQLRSQQIASLSNSNNSYQNFSIPNFAAQQQQQIIVEQPQQQQQQVTVQQTVTETEFEKGLLDITKELLEDADDDDYQHLDDVSIITARSGWDELLTPSEKLNPISPSSSSSCSSTAPVASTSAPACTKQTLVEVAAAVSEGRYEIAAEILKSAMNQPGFLNQQGSAEQKVMFYVTAALRSRLHLSPVAERSDFPSNRCLNQHSPCFKLGIMAANLSIIEATADAQLIHVVDFNIGQGSQYHSLLQLLCLRKSGKPKLVKITHVDLSANYDKPSFAVVGEKLSQIGNQAGIPVQFTSLNLNLSNLTRESLSSDTDEVLVVNLAHTLYRIADESVSTDNPRDHLLRRVKGLKPRVTTIVEQELNCNSSQLGLRLNECCSYYGALFDSLDAILAKDNPERVNIEKEVSQKITNSIACEGIDRVERCEVYGKWKARMSMAGFQMKPLSQPITESVKNMVSSNRLNPNITIKEENGGICFGWAGRTLIVTSTWC